MHVGSHVISFHWRKELRNSSQHFRIKIHTTKKSNESQKLQNNAQKVTFFAFFWLLGFGKFRGILSTAVHVLTACSSDCSSSEGDFRLVALLLTAHPRALKWSIILH